jgi:16S rRNA (cytosine1402-N4)-methyltransferase
MNEPKIHETVMATEAIKALHIKNQANYIDATLGTGGHTLEILKSGGRVLGIDMDSEMIKLSRERILPEFEKDRFTLVQGNFSNIDEIAAKNGWNNVQGIIFDLGVSNLHLKSEERGFSFGSPDAVLDMRLSSDMQGVKASDLLNALRADQLEEMFNTVLEGGASRWLTKKVLQRREMGRIETVGDFLEICSGLKTGKTGLSEATLPFLALRIAVNSELDNLRYALPKAYELLIKNGRMAVITFHSGEERIVKDFIKQNEVGENSETVSAGTEEVYKNPRSRSAKMTVIQKK